MLTAPGSINGTATDTPEGDRSAREGSQVASENGDGLVFVVSQQKCGSTMLQRMFGAPPDVRTVAEPWVMLTPFDGGFEGAGLIFVTGEVISSPRRLAWWKRSNGSASERASFTSSRS